MCSVIFLNSVLMDFGRMMEDGKKRVKIEVHRIIVWSI